MPIHIAKWVVLRVRHSDAGQMHRRDEDFADLHDTRLDAMDQAHRLSSDYPEGMFLVAKVDTLLRPIPVRAEEIPVES